MFYLFVGCAVFGGTVMILQMLLTVVGLADDSLHVDMPHSAGDHDLGGDIENAPEGDFHGDVHDGDDTDHAGSTWLFKMLSVRTLVAAMAFFGIAGLAADAAHLAPLLTLGIALAAGFAAMYGVFRAMQLLYHLRSEGTVRIHRTIGLEATVYLRIPGQRAGIGKVLVNVQNRTMEYSAMTAGPELPTGGKATVVGVIAQDTLEVNSLPEPPRGASESDERKSYV